MPEQEYTPEQIQMLESEEHYKMLVILGVMN